MQNDEPSPGAKRSDKIDAYTVPTIYRVERSKYIHQKILDSALLSLHMIFCVAIQQPPCGSCTVHGSHGAAFPGSAYWSVGDFKNRTDIGCSNPSCVYIKPVFVPHFACNESSTIVYMLA